MIRALIFATLLGGALGACSSSTRAVNDEPIGDFMRSDLVSTSGGSEGGLIVLWPRVYPAARTSAYKPLANDLQQRMVAMARKAHPGVAIDVRPQPQRVCPDRGCEAAVFGMTLMTMGEACVAVATLARPGKSPWMLARWSSGVKLKAGSTGFREPPESQFTVVEWVRCKDLLKHLDHQDSVERALKNLIRAK